MTDTSSRLNAAIAEIDAANASDPRQEPVSGVLRPVEVLYAERMSAYLERLYPAASETLRLAARAQHLRRWEVKRDAYPLGRDGYNAWRAACRTHHATLAADIMQRHGYGEAEIVKAAKIIRKEDLKRDAESQALENVVAVVFVAHYLDDFIAKHPDYSDAKLVGILHKTMRKMDATGHAAVLALDMTPAVKRVVELAVN